MENKCSTQSEFSCGCRPKSNDSCASGSCATKNTSCCQVEKSMQMWACAGEKAWKEVHVELLKTRIMKMWGPQMEKTADAVIESMGIEWQSKMNQGKAKEDLQEKIARIFSEGKK